MSPVLGIVASVQVMTEAERRGSPFPWLARWATAVETTIDPRIVVGGLLLIMLAHTVETTKFVAARQNYKSALRALATSSASDPQLGDPLFVSSQRLGAAINRMGWNSTTPYLSVLLAPELAPNQLVVDPTAGYFWLSCRTARRSEAASSVLPQSARALVRVHACLHR